MSEHYRTGKFSIANFYERRARRILPELFVVIVVSLPFAWSLLTPSELIDYSKSILSSLAFGSNFYWDTTLQEYGAESALLKPFLHTWSLAVEEQYYIVFPLILLAIYKWAKAYTVALLAAAFLISLLFAQFLTGSDASSSFYMLPSRFWELIAGSLLANILYFHPQKGNGALLNRTMPILGLYLIIHSMVFVDFDSHHPGFITLLPVLGTVLMIWFANENDLVTQILSSKILVAIGLISYALYLWHYPIFAFGRMINLEPIWYDKAIWIALTFVLSIASYFIIEKPARNKELLATKSFLAIIVMIAMLILALLMTSINQGKTATFSSSIDFRAEKKKRFAWDKYGLDICDQTKQKKACLSNPTAKKNILIVGSSMAPDAARIIGNLYPDYHYALNWAGGCLPMRDVSKKFKSGKRAKECQRLNNLRFDPKYFSKFDGVIIKTLKADSVFISEYVKHLKRNGMDNILIFGNYLRNKHMMSDLYLKYTDKKNVIDAIESKSLITDDLTYDQEMFKLSKEQHINFISIRDYACSKESGCKLFIGDYPYSWDRHHFSVEFTEYLAGKMRSDIAKTWVGKH
tara:strand:+ start:1368 stop:3098 length:1731 start_codon:yes stop_codon:yes gene_type:complete